MTNISIFDMNLEPVERSKIVIRHDGQDKEFELAEPDDYPIPELRAINRMWREISDMAVADQLTVKQGKDYDKNIDVLLKYACPNLPPEILNDPKFKRSHKTAIVTTFFIEALNRSPLKRRNDSEDQSDASIASMAELLTGV